MKNLWVFGAALVACAIPLCIATSDAAGAFPNKNINWIVPFAPGGGFDAWSRQIGAAMQKYLPQGVTVVVRNVPGAGGRAGSIALYRAKPDGYTVGLLDVPGLLPYQKAVGVDKAGFDIEKYVWIGRVATEPWVFLVAARSPLKSLADLKARKDLSWGIEGQGSTKWLFSSIEARELGLPMRFVSGYAGTGEMIPASLRGDFEIWANAGPAHIPYVKSGDLRALIQFGEKRMSALPEVPTAKELGHDLVAESLRLLAAPPGTPADAAQTLEVAFLKAMNDPEFKAWVEKSQQEANPGGQKAAAAAASNFGHLIERHMKDLVETLRKQ